MIFAIFALFTFHTAIFGHNLFVDQICVNSNNPNEDQFWVAQFHQNGAMAMLGDDSQQLACQLSKNQQLIEMDLEIFTAIKNNDPILYKLFQGLRTTEIQIKTAIQSGKLDYFDVTELKSQVTLAMMIFEKRYQMMPKKEILAPPIKGMDMDRMRREIKAIFDENRNCENNDGRQRDENGENSQKKWRKRFIQFAMNTFDGAEGFLPNLAQNENKNKRRRRKKRQQNNGTEPSAAYRLGQKVGFIMYITIIVLTFLAFILIFICPNREAQRAPARLVENRIPAQIQLVIAQPRNVQLNDIESLPSMTINQSAECSICLSQIDPGIEIKRLAGCHHVFHKDCIHLWNIGGHSDCPLCRTNMFVPKE